MQGLYGAVNRLLSENQSACQISIDTGKIELLILADAYVLDKDIELREPFRCLLEYEDKVGTST
jgi:hypothetical protein